MNEDDAIAYVRAYIEGLFPKVCARCGRRFESLADYLRTTTHLGSPVLYERLAHLASLNPPGPISHANCPCGNTLTIGSEGIPPAQMLRLLQWAWAESGRRSISMQELLRQFRALLDAEVLGEDGTG